MRVEDELVGREEGVAVAAADALGARAAVARGVEGALGAEAAAVLDVEGAVRGARPPLLQQAAQQPLRLPRRDQAAAARRRRHRAALAQQLQLRRVALHARDAFGMSGDVYLKSIVLIIDGMFFYGLKIFYPIEVYPDVYRLLFFIEKK